MSLDASAVRSATIARAPRQRSAVTNGRRSFVDGDGTAAWTRRWRDLVTAHEQDLGGADSLSEAQSSLVRRVATIEIELEQLEGRLSKGEAVDLDAYTRAASHLRRILETLGLERCSRDVTPDLHAYLAGKAAAVVHEAPAPNGNANRTSDSPNGTEGHPIASDEAA